MRNLSTMLFILSISSAVFGLLGAINIISFNFIAAIFLYFLFRELSELVMAYAIHTEQQ
jgi:hypothetical protein